jgi:TIR domain
MYDVFISHASENKETFVRQLAVRLIERNISVWYDEFSLRVGDGLRDSIDAGLTQSRFGVVVLSKDFFRKSWTNWELDGLVQLTNAKKGRRILPIWLDVDHEEILSISPSLANIVAIKSSLGLDFVVRKLLEVVKPESTSITIAGEILSGHGYDVPAPNDEWWLDVVSYDGSDSNVVNWAFSVGNFSEDNKERGQLIARKAIQMIWQDRVAERNLCQITPPSILLQEILSIGGLKELLLEHLETTVIIAPQLTIVGNGGYFESKIESMYQASLLEFSAKQVKGEKFRCEKHFALRDPLLGNYEASELLSKFINGRWGRSNTPYEYFDYLIWFLSASSKWLPENIRSTLKTGFYSWDVWIWRGWNPSKASGLQSDERLGTFAHAMYESMVADKEFRMTEETLFDLRTRLEATIELLELQESVDELCSLFLEGDFIDRTIQNHRKMVAERKIKG